MLGHVWFRRLAVFATLLTLAVIILGAWVRLTDAGLGCPDWPGCYGQILVPASPEAVDAANRVYPDRPLEQGKAWREMIHRYFASTLGLVILAMAAIALRYGRGRRRVPGQPVKLPLFLVALVIFQGLLGMWTVTLLLKPVIVTAHLLGGMATLGLLAWLSLRTAAAGLADRASADAGRGLRTAARLALAVLVIQIALGAWTSSNYAAAACPDLPTCQGQWWPEDMDFDQAFVLWHGLGIDYEGGILEHPARVAIHHTHRVGALVTSLILVLLAGAGLRSRAPGVRSAGAILLAALSLQLAVGIGLVGLTFPLSLAVAHNGGAALLLLAMIHFNHVLNPALPSLRKDR